MKKKGICYRCMFGDHKFCYHSSSKTDCRCEEILHNLEAAKISLSMDPDLGPQPFPEEPGGNDRFYFLPAPRLEHDAPSVRRLLQLTRNKRVQ